MQDRLLYHRLLWRPGNWLHSEWWRSLGLEAWQPKYPHMPLSAQRVLDLVIQRRCDEQRTRVAVLELFSPLQEALLRSVTRLPSLLTALGLLQSQCPDYLCWRPYRQALACTLTEQQLTQLWGMWRGGGRLPDVGPGEVAVFALRQGISVLDQELSDDPVWQIVRYILPVSRDDDVFFDRSAAALFLRLERFL